MANFPAAGDRNAQVPTDDGLVITTPTGNTYADQQWKDLIARGDHKRHPLAINRDSERVTGDPWAD